MKHSELCEIGAKWLKDFGCSVIAVEQKSMFPEIADCIGWKGNLSILIECKTSVADFVRDRLKTHRLTPEFGMGYVRLYLAEEGLLDANLLPEKWGLIEVTEDGKVKRTKCFPNNIISNDYLLQPNLGAERSVLLALLRK